MFLLTQTLRAQLDNRIFSFYPQPFYFIQKAPIAKTGWFKTSNDTLVEMAQIDSTSVSITAPIDSTISDTTIYPPLSALNIKMEPDTSIWPSLENPPSGTYANYMTGSHWGMLHYNKDNEYLQRINHK